MIDTQARGEIKYEWLAEYPDGDTVAQFDDAKQESYHFGHIDLSRVSMFHLISANPPSKYSVDLNSGLFYFNGIQLQGVGEKVSEHVKLIYFRRVKRSFTPGSSVQNVEISYFMGWEAKLNGGKAKHVIEIDSEGNYKVPVDELNVDGFLKL